MRHVLLTLAAIQGCFGKGAFDPPNVVRNMVPSGIQDADMLKSFRGGFSFDKIYPTRARPPQPDYDNYKYGGINFWEHELVYLEDNLVMDWQPRTGQYRIFEIVRHPDSMCPVIPENPIASGSWPDKVFHKILYIGCGGSAPGGKILDYYPSNGTYDIHRFNHKVRGSENPILATLASGFRREAMNFNPMYLNEDEVFFYEKNTGGFSIYYINSQLPSVIDPLQPPEPIVYGKLQGLHEQQVYIGQNMVLDYDPLFGRYWIWAYDRTSMNETNPFVGPLASGILEKSMVLTYVAEDQLIMSDPETGAFTVFDMKRPAALDVYAESLKTPQQREDERYKIFNLQGPPFSLKADAGNFGFGSLIIRNQCVGAGTCRQCLKRPGCGWCATNQECLRGSTIEPCATNCTTWMPVFCEAEPCSSHHSCTDCLSDPFCGFCGSDHSCMEGTHHGPLFGACSEWSKTACPNLAADAEGDVPPCVEKGIISL